VGHHPFEIGEEGGVIQGPFRSALRVPFLQRKTVCDGKPVAVNLKVGRFAACVVISDATDMME
jgi:hypothetical protein